MRSAEWLDRHRRFVLAFALILAAAGVVAAFRLPVALFPQVEFPRIAVNVDAGDRPAERMLYEVTIPVEEAVRSVPGVRSVRSRTTRGSAELSVQFDWGRDMVVALLQIQAALIERTSSLPPGTSSTVRRMDPTVFPVLGYTLVSDVRSLVELRDLAIFKVRPALSSIEGVARAEVIGGAQEEIRVELDPAVIAARGLSFADIAAALAGANIMQSAGRIEDHSKLYLVMVDSPLDGMNSVEDVVIRGPIRLRDIAVISRSQIPQWTRVTADGHDAVIVQVYQQPDGNSVQVARDAAARLAELKSVIPADVRISNWYDQSELVQSSAAGVRDAVLIGASLAALVLLVFLRNIKITIIALITVPGVLASACVILFVLGQSLNIMTLGGMAAAVGLIIDDAIVMVEHIVARVHARGVGGLRSREQTLASAAEFTRPLIGASLATIVIHVPPAFLSGVTGEFFKALSLTIAVSLVVSFFVAWLVVPLIAAKLLCDRDSRQSEGGWLRDRLAFAYMFLVGNTLKRPIIAAVPVVLLVAAALVVYPRLTTGFMPAIDEGGFVLDYKTHPGTSLVETDRIVREIEDILRSTPEVQTYSRRTGLQLGGGLTESNEGDFFIHLHHGPRRDIEEVMTSVRSQLELEVPGIQVEMMQLMEDLIGDLTAVPQPIEIKLFSEDQKVLAELAPKVAALISSIKGIVDVNDGRNIAGDAIEIHVNPLSAAVEGVDAATVCTTLEQVLSGMVVTRFQTSGDTPKVVGVRLWTPLRLRRIQEDLDQVRITASDGHSFPISRVADLHRLSGQPQIVRENLRRMVAVTARIENADLGSTIAKVKEILASPAVPEAMTNGSVPSALGGLYQEQQSAFAGLLAVFAVAVLLLFLLLLYWYESVRVAGCMIVTSLLALPGMVVGLWLTGTQVNISSLMGLAMIVGSVTEAGIFLCSEFLEPIEESMVVTQGSDPKSLRDAARLALQTAAVRRLRPITMTTLAAALSMLPLVIGLGEGAAMLRPLAIAIVAGLIVQLPLVLVVLPALLTVTRVRLKPQN